MAPKVPATTVPEQMQAPTVAGPAVTNAAPAVTARGFPEPPARSRGGLLGSKKALESELAQLRTVVDGFGYAQREALEAEIERLVVARDQLTSETVGRRRELDELGGLLVRARDELILQEVGVYDYRHRLEDSVAYKAQLDALRARLRQMSKKDGGAVSATANWSVDGSTAKGRKMVNEVSKKEAERAEKERLREEAKARREFEAERARLAKEQSHYRTALDELRQTGTPEEIATAEQRLAEINEAIELGDASVPFRYDVHALVVSDDAVTLETRLHQAFAHRRVNLVNLRREFFYATPTEVQAALAQAGGAMLEFVEEPDAEEWHQSVNARHRSDAELPAPPQVLAGSPAQPQGAFT